MIIKPPQAFSKDAASVLQYYQVSLASYALSSPSQTEGHPRWTSMLYPRNHKLVDNKVLSYNDLYGETLAIVNDGSSQSPD